MRTQVSHLDAGATLIRCTQCQAVHLGLHRDLDSLRVGLPEGGLHVSPPPGAHLGCTVHRSQAQQAAAPARGVLRRRDGGDGHGRADGVREGQALPCALLRCQQHVALVRMLEGVKRGVRRLWAAGIVRGRQRLQMLSLLCQLCRLTPGGTAGIRHHTEPTGSGVSLR